MSANQVNGSVENAKPGSKDYEIPREFGREPSRGQESEPSFHAAHPSLNESFNTGILVKSRKKGKRNISYFLSIVGG